MILALRLLGFALSSAGWWETLRKNAEISVYFIPSLTAAIQVSILFLCGLFNLLPEGAYLLYFAGIAAFFFDFRNKRLFLPRLSEIQPYCSVGFLFFGLSFLLMALFLKGKTFTHYDDYSHWALVVKRMLEVDRYPNYQDSLIIFQEYPLGSATFIYYFAKMISLSESMQMLAQVYLMLSSILPLFVFLKQRRILGLLIIISAANFFLSYNIAATDLLVDSLLPLVGLCGIVFTVLYVRKNSDFRTLCFACCYGVFLVQIKNSGMFFAGVLCLWILFVPHCRRCIRLVFASAPFVSVILWHKHCSYVFYISDMTKHALTLANYHDVISEKSFGDIMAVIKAMTQFALTWKDAWITLLLFVILGVIIYFFSRAEFKLYKQILFASAAMYILYQVGMLAMYLFSMPGKEALNLAGSVRYGKTVIIAIIYLFTILALKTVSSFDAANLPSFVVISLLFPLIYFGFMYFSSGQISFAPNYAGPYNNEERIWLESTVEGYGVPKEAVYSILVPEELAEYTHYLGRYILQSSKVYPVTAASIDKLDVISSDYILVYDDDNSIINAWLANKYPDQSGSRVIIPTYNSLAIPY